MTNSNLRNIFTKIQDLLTQNKKLLHFHEKTPKQNNEVNQINRSVDGRRQQGTMSSGK